MLKGRIALLTLVMLLATLAAPLSGVLAEGADRFRPVVRFEGVITERPESKTGTWVISGQQVEVVPRTQIVDARGRAIVGARVMVIARRLADDSLQAVLVRVIEPAVHVIRVNGFVAELGTDYLVVNALTINYNDDTEITGELLEGTFVRVLAQVTESGYLALRIDVTPGLHSRVVVFRGTIVSMDDNLWTIGERQVTVGDETTIVGTPEPGSEVEVRARVQEDGSLLALRIVVLNRTWTGLIQKLPRGGAENGWVGQWIVGDRPVVVNAETEIVGTPEVGKTATVDALCPTPGHCVATRIEVTETVTTETLAL